MPGTIVCGANLSDATKSVPKHVGGRNDGLFVERSSERPWCWRSR
jgi:hypothetical protein